MMSTREQIIAWIEQQAIPAEKVEDALRVSKLTPSGQAWLSFIDHLLLWLGGLALAFAAMFFIAYNWQDIGRFAKFAMVEAAIAVAVIAYWRLGAASTAARVALLVATILLGVLLALYGQTYQTGADPWQLFFNWAMLMLPWALLGRFAAIWLVWVMLINLSLVLYHQAFRDVFGLMFSSDNNMLWLVFAFNTLALFAWEWLTSSWRWLSARWAIRLLAVGSGVPISWLVLESIFEHDNTQFFPALVWAAWLTLLYVVYRKVRLDLFMLAGACLTGIVVIVAFFARHMLDHGDAGAFLFLAMLVIGLGTAAAVWLRNVHRELLS